MKKVFFLTAKCVKCGKEFYPRYDYAADDRWVLTYGLKEKPADGGSGGGSDMQESIANARTGPQYKCPWCGNESFIKCGRCKSITCYSGEGNATCAHCGNSGAVSGHITDVNVSGYGSGQ